MSCLFVRRIDVQTKQSYVLATILLLKFSPPTCGADGNQDRQLIYPAISRDHAILCETVPLTRFIKKK